MRVYSLSNELRDFLGFRGDDDGGMIDLTRAIAFYDVKRGDCFAEPPIDVEELIFENRLSGAFLGEVMETLDRGGLIGDFRVTEDFRINPPICPGKIVALGNNYRAHISEMNQKLPEEPVLFGKWPSTVVGHGDPIVKPSWIGRMDYEAELAFVVGSRAKNVGADAAMDVIAGYTCLNDVSARDIQRNDLSRSLPWMPSKNFDTFCPLGPCILPADLVKPPVEIDVRCSVNGEMKQDGNTRDFIFDIPFMIEYITKIMALEPGDVVTTGTPSGVGPIEPGDEVSVTCSGVGTLTNPVTAPDSESR